LSAFQGNISFFTSQYYFKLVSKERGGLKEETLGRFGTQLVRMALIDVSERGW